jgi:hypothetical protein
MSAFDKGAPILVRKEAPAAAKFVPAGHTVHCSRPADAANVPVEHTVHA